jgi:hypothetical protein
MGLISVRSGRFYVHGVSMGVPLTSGRLEQWHNPLISNCFRVVIQFPARPLGSHPARSSGVQKWAPLLVSGEGKPSNAVLADAQSGETRE